jgi:UDP-N-acetylmuramate dehydrogenase
MNAGAHGGEFSAVVQEVELLSAEGELIKMAATELKFSYRHSFIPPGALVIGARIKLTPGDPARCIENRSKNLKYRKETQPLTVPSFGSVFRNPVDRSSESAGALIERCGLKGFCRGGAQVSTLHANWIVNPTRKATASDYCAVIAECQQQVLSRFAVELRPEVVLW